MKVNCEANVSVKFLRTNELTSLQVLQTAKDSEVAHVQFPEGQRAGSCCVTFSVECDRP